MKTVTIKAPAKVNLTLDVTGKRPNGYHDLKMIMQTISVFDEIKLSLTEEEKIDLHMNKELPDKIPAEKNLVYKAAALMKEKFDIKGGFDIELQKSIPAAAGLAGGSSDCAATLIAINEVCELGLTTQELCDIGVKLGADVPFCIRKGTMLSEGIGEILTPLTPFKDVWVVLVKPDISVSTAYVYTHLDLPNLKYHPDTDKAIECIDNGDISGLSNVLSNVLETVTVPEYPVLTEIKEFLVQNGAAGSLMSGSGPTVFGIFKNKEDARRAYDKAGEKYRGYDVLICQTM